MDKEYGLRSRQLHTCASSKTHVLDSISTNMVAFWDTEKEEELINAIQKRQCIWDKTIPVNPTNLNKAWTEVLNQMPSYNRTQLKSKWRTLCTTFQKVRNELPKPTSGSAAMNISSSWEHFDSMKFMLDKVNNETSGNVKDFSNDQNTSMIEVTPPTPSTSKPSPATPQKSMVYDPQKTIPKTCSFEDAEGMNLASLMPYVRSIKDPQLKLRFRTEVNDMLLKFMFPDKDKRLADVQKMVEDPDCMVVDCRFNQKKRSTDGKGEHPTLKRVKKEPRNDTFSQ